MWWIGRSASLIWLVCCRPALAISGWFGTVPVLYPRVGLYGSIFKVRVATLGVFREIDEKRSTYSWTQPAQFVIF